ncbi:hypothetical protein BUALT_Bualt03G0201500 [Buddleja alternifolia]|uniref:F-box domain-containing protein n=1 Tax=Buddleja alternifolia TaxID=168488 RepID=A0AAV6XZN9_9LAMI|nr:hypothetical protein BUALT_Bualt03G0201500 [Buddleja alternifolia]
MAETSIKDLPVDLLVRILSYVPTIDASRATLVSQQWQNLWHHIARLNFDMSLYHSPSKKNLFNSREDFAEIVTQTLLLRPKTTPLDSFRLVFSYRRCLRTQRQVDSWIRHAITSGVGIFRLSFEGEQFIKTEGDSFARVCRNDGFPSLTSIYLHDVTLNDEVLFAMVSNCVNLEFLSLSCLRGLRNFKIHSDSLEELVLGYFKPSFSRAVGSLDICAPNLSTIAFEFFCVKKYYSSDLSSLVEADLDFTDGEQRDYIYCWDILKLLSGVDSLDILNLNINQYILFEFVDIKYAPHRSVLMNVKYLALQTEYEESDLVRIGEFLKLCPELELLVLDSLNEKDGRDSKEFKSKPLILEIPSLKQVEMKNYRGSENELYVVEVLKTHKVVLQKIVAFQQEVNGKLPPPFVLFDTS